MPSRFAVVYVAFRVGSGEELITRSEESCRVCVCVCVCVNSVLYVARQ